MTALLSDEVHSRIAAMRRIASAIRTADDGAIFDSAPSASSFGAQISAKDLVIAFGAELALAQNVADAARHIERLESRGLK